MTPYTKDERWATKVGHAIKKQSEFESVDLYGVLYMILIKRSCMARVHEGWHSFTCNLYVYPQVDEPYLPLFPAAERHRTLAATHFPSR